MAERLSDGEITKELKTTPGWERREQELYRQFKFDDFKAAMVFVNRVAAETEALDHHPDILIQYSRVKLTISTHSAGGLTMLDFELARKINAF